jgi:hypothetical protein
MDLHEELREFGYVYSGMAKVFSRPLKNPDFLAGARTLLQRQLSESI